MITLRAFIKSFIIHLMQLPELRTKLHDRTPILADLARLRWIESELAARDGLVVWIDADTLVV